ncbi:MAG: alpha/beta fold hydrolase [Planctomycetota bacterium]
MVCDRFERIWLDGRTPSLGDFLDQVDADQRGRLFTELLKVDIEYRGTANFRLDSDSYSEQYPTFRNEIETVFASLDPTTIGRFEVLSELGRGGMGVVYLAKDPELGRRIAIKLIPAGKDRDAQRLARFQREATLASQINHPNILTIFEVGRHRGTLYLASEYIEGETLWQRIKRETLSLTEAIDVASQLIAAISVAHQNEIIHRDLKPENIMIRNDGLLKVLDFGLAKSAVPTSVPAIGGIAGPAAESLPGSLMGTLQYMSPEQIRGQAIGCSADLFSFGIVTSLLVTGQHPFAGATPSDTMASILKSDPVIPLGDDHPDLVELKALIGACLRKDSAQRPTASVVRDRLGEVKRLLAHRVGNLGGDTATSLHPSHASAADANTIPLDKESTLENAAVRYARSDDVNIAWQSIGSGPIDLVFVMGWVSHLEWLWREPSFASFIKQLAKFARVILFDKRGTGLSDKVPNHRLPNLEDRMDDVRAVMQAAGSKKAVLCGVSEGGPLCSLFAATFPQKTLALVMIGSYAKRLRTDGYPWGPSEAELDAFLKTIETQWGGPVGIESRAPSKAKDPQFRSWWASYLRMGASPGAAVTLTRMNSQIDIRRILPNIQVPTLVLHREGDQCLLVEEGKYLADHIPGAKFVVFPGDDHLPFVGDSAAIVQQIEQFLDDRPRTPTTDRVLATIVCISLASKAAEDGRFIEAARHTVDQFRGETKKGQADEFLAIFDGPVRAVDAAHRITADALARGLTPRTALHTGACDVMGTRVSGPAVQKARRLAGLAPQGSVYVTDSLRSLVSDLELHLSRESFPGESDFYFRSSRKI